MREDIPRVCPAATGLLKLHSHVDSFQPRADPPAIQRITDSQQQRDSVTRRIRGAARVWRGNKIASGSITCCQTWLGWFCSYPWVEYKKISWSTESAYRCLFSRMGKNLRRGFLLSVWPCVPLHNSCLQHKQPEQIERNLEMLTTIMLLMETTATEITISQPSLF